MAKKESRPTEVVWLSLEQAAHSLGMEPETLRRWSRDGDARVPAYKVWDDDDIKRGRFRFKQSDVEAFQAVMQAAEPSPPSS